MKTAIEQTRELNKEKPLKERPDGSIDLNQLRDWIQPLLRNRAFSGPGFRFGGGMRRPPMNEDWTAEERAQFEGLTGPELFRKQAELFRKKHGLPADGPMRGKGPPPGSVEGPGEPPKDGPPEREPGTAQKSPGG